jgi:uncharacterized protein YkwD
VTTYKLKKTLEVLTLIAIIFVGLFIVFENYSSWNSKNTSSDSSSHDELVQFALSLINSDRQRNGLQNVTLSSINSGQQHAEEMLAHRFFSHWDTNGYKPYIRYSLAGGKGAISENIGLVENWSAGNSSLKQALNESEWDMMYNDADWNWGHKENILNPLHNKVSIGIAYDANYLYFVEDFENDYISWIQLNTTNNEVMMEGKLSRQIGDIQQIAIFYDNPSPLTANQLQQAPYQGGYDTGTYIGSVLPPNWQASDGITITADNWYRNDNSFRISFSLLQVLDIHLHGVYTFYLETGNSTAEALTSYSLFV